MSSIKLQGSPTGTGALTIAAPTTNTDRTLTLPDSTGALVAADATGRIARTVLPTGTLLNSAVVTTTAQTNWTTGSWFTLWTPSYTPVSANSRIIAMMSLSLLPEGTNTYDLYASWPGGEGLYWYGMPKAAGITNWFLASFPYVYESNNSSTATQSLTVQARGNGSNMNYFNYPASSGQTSRSSVVFLEFAR